MSFTIQCGVSNDAKSKCIKKVENSEIFGCLRNIISKKLRTNEKTILRIDELENPKSRSRIY
jgi:hypothetical protein